MNYGKFNENDKQVISHFPEVSLPLRVLFPSCNWCVSARVLKLLPQAAGLAARVSSDLYFY